MGGYRFRKLEGRGIGKYLAEVEGGLNYKDGSVILLLAPFILLICFLYTVVEAYYNKYYHGSYNSASKGCGGCLT